MVGSLFAQITTTKVAKGKDSTIEPYDSTLNYLGKDVYKYIGQELYLKGKSETLREYGYRDFIKNYKKDASSKRNIYKCCESYNSKYDELAGKYFSVLAVHKDPNKRSFSFTFFLELKEKDSGDIVFYKYNSQFKKYNPFPFIVVGYFVKQKQFYIDKEFIVKGKNWRGTDKPMHDMYTGQPVSFDNGSRWKCIDLTIEEKYFTLSLILQNEKGENISCPINITNNKVWVFYADDADRYKEEFGEKNWNTILKEDILIGFTEEMVELSWGRPESINKSSYGDQWVYSGRYLYFEYGKLKSFNPENKIIGFAKEKTFVREYTYQASEYDSKVTSRANSIEQIKRILLEEVSVFIKSEVDWTQTEELIEGKYELTDFYENKIQTITAGITETVILDEKWTGVEYWIKAEITIDPDDIKSKVDDIIQNKEKLKELENLKKSANDALVEIEMLKKELAETKSEAYQLTLSKFYNKQTDILTASDWFTKAYNAEENKEHEKAISFYLRCIELNPEYADAYNNIGMIYRHLGQHDKVIELYKKVIGLTPDYETID